MEYIVGYRKYEIVRAAPDTLFRIRLRDAIEFLPGEYRSFADARRECDYLMGGNRASTRRW